jgi:hypothetical protein
MLNLKAIAIAAALTLSTAGLAVSAEGSAMDALTSATTVSFKTVTAAEITPSSPGYQEVDLDSLKARIQGSPALLAQLESYGATLDDVVGITGTDATDVTILVQG